MCAQPRRVGPCKRNMLFVSRILNGLLGKRRVSGQKVLRARVLFKAYADGPSLTDAEIAKAFDCRTKTVENIRERLVTKGFEIALNGNPKSRVRRKVLDGDQEAKIIALRLGPPPQGFANWTLRLLAEQTVALEIVESVSHETLRGARSYDSRYRVLCIDGQQLLKETRTPIAGTEKHPRRVDYEYERAGTASILMFCEALAGWRQVSVRERRTKVDWAQEMQSLLRTC